LPLDPPRQYVAQPTDQPATVRVYAGRDGEFRWYEDDGATLDYLKGKFAWIRLQWSDRERRLSIEPGRGRGAFETAPRTLVIELTGYPEFFFVRIIRFTRSYIDNLNKETAWVPVPASPTQRI
jgi:hypothetical protein